MNAKQIIAGIAVILAVVCLLPSVDGAEITDRPGGVLDFDNMDGGDITFTVESDNGFSMVVTVTENGRVVTTKNVDIRAGTNTVTVHISDPTPGEHQYRVECAPAGEFQGSNGFNVTADVGKNILSNWATYAVIIVVIIVIVIFAYLKMRDTPKNKPEMTFEELEAQRKAEMAQKAEKKQKKPALPTAEKKRYGEKKESSEAPKEKKKQKPEMTFEELEAQKQAEKAAKAEKKSEKKSTGLTEREKYLEEKRKKKEE